MTTTDTVTIGKCIDCKRAGLPYMVSVVNPERGTVNCTACGYLISLDAVNGKVSKRACDTHCTEGTGRSCSCECGGAHHGFAWRVR